MILACSPIDTGVTSYLIDSALIYTSNYQARMAELYPQQICYYFDSQLHPYSLDQKAKVPKLFRRATAQRRGACAPDLLINLDLVGHRERRGGSQCTGEGPCRAIFFCPSV